MDEQMKRLQALYADYINQCRKASMEAPYAAGILSPGKDPRNHPCHAAFFDAVGDLIGQIVRENTGEPVQMVRWMLEEPYFYANEEACWYLLAAQAHVKRLIPLLGRESKREIRLWFNRLVPKNQRLPVQEEILRLLSH